LLTQNLHDMKTTIYSIIWLALLFIGCANQADEVLDFIPGTYAHAFTDSLNETTNTVGIDTLEIKKATGGESDRYEIQRRMKFRRTVDGQVKPDEYKTENWKGIYDKDKKVIQEISKGKVISFVPEKNILLVNSVEYKKLK
jgi:hypothetical protein